MKYECAYCGAKYDTPKERTDCEERCFLKQEETRDINKEKASAEIREMFNGWDSLGKKIEKAIREYNETYNEVPNPLSEKLIDTLIELFKL